MGSWDSGSHCRDLCKSVVAVPSCLEVAFRWHGAVPSRVFLAVVAWWSRCRPSDPSSSVPSHSRVARLSAAPAGRTGSYFFRQYREPLTGYSQR